MSQLPPSAGLLTSLFGTVTKSSKAPPMDISTQRKHLRAALDKAPPSVNATRPGRGSSNGCSGVILSATPIPPGPKTFSKGTIWCLIQSDEPLVAQIKPPKFKYLDEVTKNPELVQKEKEIRDQVNKNKAPAEMTLYSGSKICFTYKQGPDAGQLAYGDQITIQGLDIALQYAEMKDDPGKFHGSFFYNVNMIVKVKSASALETDEILEKLSLEQSIPIVFTKPISDTKFLDKLKEQSDRITTITRIGGPDSTLEENGGYWITVDGVPADKLSITSKFGKGEGKSPGMMSSLAGYISNGVDILPFSYTTSLYESHIAAAWDITSAELWTSMFKTLMSDQTRTYIIGTYDTKATSTSHRMCRPPAVFSTSFSIEEETDESTKDVTEVAKYKTLDAAFGFAVTASVVVPEFLSLVRIGYPIISSKTVKILLPAKGAPVAGQTSRTSSTQSRGFVCANSASSELVDDLLKLGWVGIYITNHPPITNNGDVIPPFQIPADLIWTADYPKDEKGRKSRIAKGLAVQRENKDRDPNPLVMGLEKLSKRSGPPDINKADSIIYLIEPAQYHAAIDKLLNPSKSKSDSVDTGALGLLVKQSELSRENAVKMVETYTREKAIVAAETEGITADDLKFGEDEDNGDSKVLAVATPSAEEKEPEGEDEVPAHQPEDTGDDDMDDGNDKKRAHSDEEDEDTKPPPAKKSKFAERIAKATETKKKAASRTN